MNNYIKVATVAAKKAGKIFKTNFGRPKHINIKNGNPKDLVTEIDKKIEILIRKIILQNFPKHKIIGEEFAKDKIEQNDLVWIIDPIDGTTNYIYGLPLCCISIALWDKTGPLVAVIFNPVTGQLYSAQRGKGARLNNKKIVVSTTPKAIEALGTIGWAREVKMAKRLFAGIINQVLKIRVFATCAWQMCLVASGNTDFYVSISEKLWDFAAGALIVKEAGGKVTDLSGIPLSPKTKTIIASNGKIHSQLLSRLKKISG